MPHAVQENAAQDSFLLQGLLESDVDRLQARRRVHADPREDLGRNVDFGVAQAVRRQGARHGERRLHVVLGPAKEPTDLGIEQQEALRVSHGPPRRIEGGGIGEGMVAPLGQARDLLGRKTALEVEVAIGEEGHAASRERGVRSHGLAKSPIPNRRLSTHNRHLLYMRRTRLLALFLDVLACAAVADLAGLGLTAIVWRFLPAARDAIPWIWGGLAAVAIVVFLLRDARGGRARRWLALEVRLRRRPASRGLALDRPQPAAAHPRLEPFRRLAGLSRRRRPAPLRPGSRIVYLADNMRDGSGKPPEALGKHELFSQSSVSKVRTKNA